MKCAKTKRKFSVADIDEANTPVAMAVGFFMIQLGMTRPENMEKPKMKMFLEEFMSVY